MYQYSRVWLIAALSLSLACASRSQVGEGDPSLSTAAILTQEEMQDLNVRNLYEAIQELRPRWLYVRAVRSLNDEAQIAVFQERAFLGNEDQLRRLGLNGVYWLEYIDGPRAQATLPGLRDMFVEGAIVVHMSPRETGR